MGGHRFFADWPDKMARAQGDTRRAGHARARRLTLSIYGIGWTTDLGRTMSLVATWLRPGARFVASGEHPLYSCLRRSGAEYTIAGSSFAEGPQEHASWKGQRVRSGVRASWRTY